MGMVKAARKFHELYQGPPISLWITGGGYSFLEVLKIPGASRFISDIVIPYSEKDILARLKDHRLINPLGCGSASEEAVKVYAEYLTHATTVGNGICLAVSAALTTNRYRRGKNRAYFSLVDVEGNCTSYYFEMMKPIEKLHEPSIQPQTNNVRLLEDERVSLAMMGILTGKQEEFPLDLNDDCLRYITMDWETKESFVRL